MAGTEGNVSLLGQTEHLVYHSDKLVALHVIVGRKEAGVVTLDDLLFSHVVYIRVEPLIFLNVVKFLSCCRNGDDASHYEHQGKEQSQRLL